MALFEPRPPLVPRTEGGVEPLARRFTLHPYETETEELIGRGLVVREVGGDGSDRSVSELTWEDDGIQGVNVAEEGFHLADLQHRSFDPGHPVRIVPNPDDPLEPGTLEVRDPDGVLHPGHIRAEDREFVRRMLAAGETVVLTVWSWRAREDGERRHLRLLFARAGALEEERYRHLHPPLE